MNFKYDVYSDEEIEKMSNKFNVGSSTFYITDAEQTVSKNGNSMIKLTVKLWDDGGIEISVKDYLVNLKTMAWKIKHFCEATGMDYSSGGIDAVALTGKDGKCLTYYQKSDDGKEYVRIKDYIKREESMPKTGSESGSFDDDLPF